MTAPVKLDDYVHTFVLDVIHDAMRSGIAQTWLRRAADFEAARPRPDDFHGDATQAELSARWQRLTDIAEACRRRARLARDGDLS